MVKKRPKPKTKQLVTPTATRETSATRESINDDVIAAAISSIPPTVLMKVCRLCETKDGPFLNIFDSDRVTAKKIDEVMPFGIAENDDLPHKICFRCSAKVEELYEFIQKCIKSQESLQTAVGKRGPLIMKTKTRALWEVKLNKTNLSNDDICNALVKKAMEGIQDIPLNPLPIKEEKTQPPNQLSKKIRDIIGPLLTSKKEKEPPASSIHSNQQLEDEHEEVSLKQVKLTLAKCDDKITVTRISRSNKSEPERLVDSPKTLKQYPSRKSQKKLIEPTQAQTESTNDVKQTDNQNSPVDVKNKDKIDRRKPNEVPAKVEETPSPAPTPPPPSQPPPPPINIMDHVSTIKVNGVGTLFLCKLCNRNFLKKEVVMTHGCAKNNVPKDSFLQNHVPPPEVPKPPTVKYIKMDKNFKKPILPETKPAEIKPGPSDTIRVNIPVQAEVKSKPKAGPASKVRQQTHSEVPKDVTPKEPTPPPPQPKPTQVDKPIIPAVQFPGLPSLNSRYKLVPGPNNTFTLVEDTSKTVEIPIENKVPPLTENKSKKRKLPTSAKSQELEIKKLKSQNESSLEVIDLEDNILREPPIIGNPYPVGQPYPVGLFQTVPHHSGVFAPNTHPQPPAFTTPAMKKQSYTIVQTGNPSKLLISTKPQPIVEEQSRKKSKKSKPDMRDVNKEPFNVTIEDNGRPKDSGFFTFINVDPLLQPSYVLPTNNIIQESQISTSTPASKGILENKEKEKYHCNMCEEKFSREKKLLAHIQSHFNQMDEEDQRRADKTGPKRKSRKS